MHKKFYIPILIIVVIVIFGWYLYQTSELEEKILEGIIFEGEEIMPDESFTIKLPPTTEVAELKLLRIVDENTIEIGYPDSLVGSEDHPGLCTEREDKQYRMEIVSGSCLSTNSCDGGVKACFELARENSFIVVSYDTEQW